MSEKAKKWIVAAGKRAAKTAAQAVLVLTGSDMVNILTLDWRQIVGVAVGMAFVSLLMSVAGLPEVKSE
ncbi:MAG: hypothetical protein J6C37_10725 [Roseburia sp.]|nr:hypothetical protein [Roseburia sp.]